MTIKEQMDKDSADCEVIFLRAKAGARELTAEEVVEKDRLFASIRGAKRKLTLEHDRDMAGLAFARGDVGLSRLSLAEREFTGQGSMNADASAKTRKLYNEWLRSGANRDLFVITTGSGSGALLPVEIGIPAIVRRPWNWVFSALAATGYKPIETASTDTLTIPVMDDTAVAGDQPAEDASGDTAADPALSTITLASNLFSSKSIWLSQTMLSAVSYDMLGYISPILQKRVDLEMDVAWTTALLAGQVSGNTVTAAAEGAVTYAELVSWWHKLPVQYRADAVWVVSDTLFAAIQQLSDSVNRPLLTDSLIVGFKQLFGLPIVVAQNMPAVGANAVTGCVISGECIKCRLCPQRIARYVDVPTFPDQLGLRQFANAGAGFVFAGAAFLKMGAS